MIVFEWVIHRRHTRTIDQRASEIWTIHIRIVVNVSRCRCNGVSIELSLRLDVYIYVHITFQNMILQPEITSGTTSEEKGDMNINPYQCRHGVRWGNLYINDTHVTDLIIWYITAFDRIFYSEFTQEIRYMFMYLSLTSEHYVCLIYKLHSQTIDTALEKESCIIPRHACTNVSISCSDVAMFRRCFCFNLY